MELLAVLSALPWGQNILSYIQRVNDLIHEVLYYIVSTVATQANCGFPVILYSAVNSRYLKIFSSFRTVWIFGLYWFFLIFSAHIILDSYFSKFFRYTALIYLFALLQFERLIIKLRSWLVGHSERRFVPYWRFFWPHTVSFTSPEGATYYADASRALVFTRHRRYALVPRFLILLLIMCHRPPIGTFSYNISIPLHH